MRVYNFGGSGHNLVKFYQRMWLIAGVIKWTLILQGVPPTRFGRVKNVQNSARFLTVFEFDRKYLWNGSTYRKSEKYLINYISSPIGRKKFGELWSTNNKVIDAQTRMLTHSTGLFWKTIFRPLGGAGPSNFYTC